MNKAVIYIHGKGGNVLEARHYKDLFPECDVIGLDYKSNTPWEAKEEFPRLFDEIAEKYDSVCIIANSIGAFFAMNSLSGRKIQKAFFISPIVNMEKLIRNMMLYANVSEEELEEKKEITTDFGEKLSFDYLSYVRNNPIKWTVPTVILYGLKDNLTSYETVSEFSTAFSAHLTVMENGEHWFHTSEQMAFLDKWMKNSD